MNLILVEAGAVDGHGVLTLSGAQAEHVATVLRATPGHEVRVGILDGARGVGTVTTLGPGTVTLRCAFEPTIPPRPAIDVLLAVPRPKVLRRLWAQLAALGVGRIVLTNAARVERPYFDTHVLTPDCYRPLLVEGLQQARDTRVPVVSIHRQLRILIEDELDGLCPDGLRVVAHPGAAASVPGLVQAHPGRRLLLAIGPEGGWNAFELALLEAHGFHPAGMGPRPLRVDTACIALLALAQSSQP